MCLKKFFKNKKTEKNIIDRGITKNVSTQTKIMLVDKAEQLAEEIEIEINKKNNLTPPQKKQLRECADNLKGGITKKIKDEKKCNLIMSLIAGELKNLDIIIFSESSAGIQKFINRIELFISDYKRGDSALFDSKNYERYKDIKTLEDKLYEQERNINSELALQQRLFEEGDYAQSTNNRRRLAEIQEDIEECSSKIANYRRQKDEIMDAIRAIETDDSLSKELENMIDIKKLSDDKYYKKISNEIDSWEKLGMLRSEDKGRLVKKLEDYYAQSKQSTSGFKDARIRGTMAHEDAQQERLSKDADLLGSSGENPSESWEDFKKKIKEDN